MPVRAFCLAFALFTVPDLASAASGGGQCWVFEAVGAQAPQEEFIEIRPGAVRWLDAQGRTQWHQRRDSGLLTLLDHDARIFYTLDEAGISLLRAELQAALAAPRVNLGSTARPAPQRPWVAVDAADNWSEPRGLDHVAGLACQRLVLKVDERTVGEACVADASALAGGPALLQMLQAQVKFADPLRASVPGAAAIVWPLHPLMAVARSGRLPLRVPEAVEGGHRVTGGGGEQH